jgi:excisionase family DNA binding protein
MPSSAAWLSPPAVAARLGVDSGKVLAWIHSGELRAANVALRRNRRPRWRIAEADLLAFLAARSATPLPRVQRRGRKQLTVTEFY